MRRINIGDKVIPIRNTNSHNYTLNRVYTVVHLDNPPGSVQAVDSVTGWRGNSLNISDCKIQDETVNEIRKRIGELQSELDRYEKMLLYIEETKKESIITSEFITWYLLKILNSDDKDKFNKISKILNTISNNLSTDILKYVGF